MMIMTMTTMTMRKRGIVTILERRIVTILKRRRRKEGTATTMIIIMTVITMMMRERRIVIILKRRRRRKKGMVTTQLQRLIRSLMNWPFNLSGCAWRVPRAISFCSCRELRSCVKVEVDVLGSRP